MPNRRLAARPSTGLWCGGEKNSHHSSASAASFSVMSQASSRRNVRRHGG